MTGSMLSIQYHNQFQVPQHGLCGSSERPAVCSADMCDAEVLRAASNIPRRLLESEGLRSELARLLPGGAE